MELWQPYFEHKTTKIKTRKLRRHRVRRERAWVLDVIIELLN